MHIKFERAWKYVLLAPTAVLACALPFALAPDISFHYYLVAAPQLEAAATEYAAEHGGTGHAADGHATEAQHDEAAHDHQADKHAVEHQDEAHPPAKKKAEKKAH